MTAGGSQGNRPPGQPPGQATPPSLQGSSDGGRCPRCGVVIAASTMEDLERCCQLAQAAQAGDSPLHYSDEQVADCWPGDDPPWPWLHQRAAGPEADQ